MRPKRKEKLIYKLGIEGIQEAKYLSRLQQLINTCDDSKYNVEFKWRQKYGGSPLVICKRASEIESIMDVNNKTTVAMFDYDNKSDSFIDSLRFCKSKGIIVAYSNMCFQLWLVLHKKYITNTVNNVDGYDSIIRKIYEVDDQDLKSEKVSEKIVEQLSLSDIIIAIKNAEKLRTYNEENERLMIRINEEAHFYNPTVTVDVFVKMVLKKCGLI